MKKGKKKETYKCEACGGVYEKSWTDKEAMQEAKKLWSPILLEHTSIICDDCFKKGIKRFN